MSVAGTVPSRSFSPSAVLRPRCRGSTPQRRSWLLRARGLQQSLAEFRQGDAMALPFPDDRFDVAVMALVIFFVPDPSKGVAEMARVVCPGGTVAAYAWDLLGGGFPNEPIQAELRAMGVAHLRPPSADASRMEALRGLWKGAGIEAIETREISVERTFKDFDDVLGHQCVGLERGTYTRLDACRGCRGLEISCSQRACPPTPRDASPLALAPTPSKATCLSSANVACVACRSGGRARSWPIAIVPDLRLHDAIDTAHGGTLYAVDAEPGGRRPL